MSNDAYVHSVLGQKFGPISNNLSQTETIETMADIIRQLLTTGPKTVSVIGGAASGKTTIAEGLVSCLQQDDAQTDMLSTDNYVVGDRAYRQVKLKNADAQKKYDFNLMDEHVRAIRQLNSKKQTVTVPLIDKETGRAVDAGEDGLKHDVGKLDVLIIEGDFPRDDYDIRFYIHVPDEQRLQNNIEREVGQAKNVDTGQLTARFNDRQRTLHKPYTLPALQSADYVLVANVAGDDWLYTMHQRIQ